jgi:hypothetical protein
MDLKRGSSVDQKVFSSVADEKVLSSDLDERNSFDVGAVVAVAEDTVEAAHQCEL